MIRYPLLSLAALLALILGSPCVTAATPVASPMATPVVSPMATPVVSQCDALRDYLLAIESLQIDASEGFEELLSRDPASLRPAQQREIAGMLEQLATAIAGMDERDIPAAAGEFHRAVVEALNTMADAYNALATNNAATFFRLSAEVESALDRVDRARDGIEAICGFRTTTKDDLR